MGERSCWMVEMFHPKPRSKNQIWWAKCHDCRWVAEPSGSKLTIEREVAQHKGLAWQEPKQPEPRRVNSW